MRLPTIEECRHDMFLMNLRDNDLRQFLSQRRGANQRFHGRRRVMAAVDFLRHRLPPPPLRIADVGCGTADFGLTMAELGYNVDLIDTESGFFDYIRLKDTTQRVRYIHSDIQSMKGSEKYPAVFFGEALEHMAHPDRVLLDLRELLPTGGLLCLTTPNGDYLNCYTENWTTVRHQTERNLKVANTLGNHVCEFTKQELSDLVKEAGFSILAHELIISDWISKHWAPRWLLPEGLLWKWDSVLSRRHPKPGKDDGKTQILLAQRVK